MARRRRTSLGTTPHCRLPADHVSETCGTEGKLTLCVGDRVTRAVPKGKAQRGIVMAIQPGRDNRKRAALAARVCFTHDEPGDLAYPFLFSELRKG